GPGQLQEAGRPELVERRRRAAIVGDARAPTLVEVAQPRHLVAPLGEALAGAEGGGEIGEDREVVSRLAPGLDSLAHRDEARIVGRAADVVALERHREI